MTRASRVLAAVRDRFGFETLRPGQEEAMTAVVGGRDTVWSRAGSSSRLRRWSPSAG